MVAPAPPLSPSARYIRSLTSESQYKIAARTGMHYSTVYRWITGERTPRAEHIALLARAYGRNPVEALTICGFFTKAEANLVDAHWTDPALVPTDVLLAEVARRSAGEGTAA